jgi:hypothetical protein
MGLVNTDNTQNTQAGNPEVLSHTESKSIQTLYCLGSSGKLSDVQILHAILTVKS